MRVSAMKIDYRSMIMRQRLRRTVIVAAALIIAAWAGAEALAQGKAAGAGSGELDLWTMGMGLLGGLALFLFGMEQMADALKALAADRLKDIIARLTTNRYMGAFTGAVVTAIIQSSSVTTVLTVGFITAGILSVSQSVGIIFGANIGSTLTAQLIAFKVTKLSLLMIAVGFAMLFISGKDKVRQYGTMIMGLGLVFFGMGLMSSAMNPLRSYQPFLDLMVQMERPALAILVATVFTGLIQSSAATTGVVIAMAGQGLISLNVGIALIFGANIGTCVTALLASIGKPRGALRASLIHVLFNILGVVLWVGFIDQLARLVVDVSPVAAGLSGLEKQAAETPRQVANAHSIFNIANTLIFLPFGTQFARLVEYLLPEREDDKIVSTGTATEWTTQHLDLDLLAVPSIALEQTRSEIKRMARLVMKILKEVMPGFISNDPRIADRMLEQEAEVKYVGQQIDEFLVQISRRHLNQEQSEFATQLMDVTADLKRIGKLIRKDLGPLLHRKAEARIAFLEEGRDGLLRYYDSILASFGDAIRAFEENNAELAREVVRAKPGLIRQQRDYRATHYDRLDEGKPDSVAVSEIHLDLVDHLRRVYSLSESIAFTMLEGYLDRRKGERMDRQKAIASTVAG
ncbi:MAG: Na/Pi cotransporter family protein [Candidatus Glassbacteria bacterium]|nr:Na/Pi cotransporter family protein [Candidatus Glassbacteria bacterium]